MSDNVPTDEEVTAGVLQDVRSFDRHQKLEERAKNAEAEADQRKASEADLRSQLAAAQAACAAKDLEFAAIATAVQPFLDLNHGKPIVQGVQELAAKVAAVEWELAVYRAWADAVLDFDFSSARQDQVEKTRVVALSFRKRTRP